MTTDGRMRGALELYPAGSEGLDYAHWRKLTELGLAEAERRATEAREAIEAARRALAAREQEVRVLRRVLDVAPGGTGTPAGRPAPPPPAKGTRTGEGPGGRAAAFLLEVARHRPDHALTPKVAQRSCPGWPEGTVHDGLERLVADGLAEHPERGVYRLTARGLAAAPAATGTLRETKPIGED